jgi:hypothetical protein
LRLLDAGGECDLIVVEKRVCGVVLGFEVLW